MTVNYTTNLALGQPVTGTESGTWGDDVNNAVTSYLDIAIAGGLSVTVTTADVTLTLTQGTSVATNIGSTTAQYAILNVSGAMTAARSLIVPSSSRQYVINNNTTGGFALTVKGSATSGVTMVNGEKAHVFWNGSDYAKLSNAPGGAGTFSSITNTGLTSGRVVFSTSGGLETDSANLTFDGTNLTLAGGTANGVTYLNGSKVLTSGSALTFDGTNFATTGSISTTIASKTAQFNAAGGSIYSSFNDGTKEWRTGVGIQSAGLFSIRNQTNAVDAVNIDSSGNVGIGTTTPSTFVASGGLALAGAYGTSSAAFSIYNNTAASASNIAKIDFRLANTFSGTGPCAAIYGMNPNAAGNNGGALVLATSANGTNTTPTEAMRIDQAGNVGIGTSSPATKLQINKSSQTPGDTTPSGALLITNTAAGDGCIEIGSGSSVLGYLQVRNRLSATYYDLAINPNGGLVGIGTSSPTAQLTLSSATANTNGIQLKATGWNYINRLGQNGTSGDLVYWSNNYNFAASTIDSASYGTSYVLQNATSGFISFGTATTNTAPSERMRIDSSGNVGIGTSSPAGRLDVQSAEGRVILTSTTGTNASYYTAVNTGGSFFIGRDNSVGGLAGTAYAAALISTGAYPMVFGTSSVERMRIDSSGNLLVGQTTLGLTTTQSFSWQGTGDGAFSINHSTSNVNGDGFIRFGYNGTQIGGITQSGTTAVLYNTTSDQRLKENIQDANSASALIDAIQVRQFDWKSDNTHQRYGFVAQELVTVAPEAVHQPNDPEEMMAVDYSKLVPMLVKEIQSLRKRLTALEST